MLKILVKYDPDTEIHSVQVFGYWIVFSEHRLLFLFFYPSLVTSGIKKISGGIIVYKLVIFITSMCNAQGTEYDVRKSDCVPLDRLTLLLVYSK